jgi:hypothetical protein
MDGLEYISQWIELFLEGMPVNAIEKIEIITQPGAEFPCNFGSNFEYWHNKMYHLSATYTNSSSFTDYI